VLGKNSPPLFDKNELHTFLKNNDKGNQSSIEMGGIYKPKKEPKKPDDHAKNQDKGDQSKDPKKQDSQNKKGNGGDQSEGIYKPKKDPKKPDSPDKNGNGGDDHGQSL
jgi:hypothetical protein